MVKALRWATDRVALGERRKLSIAALAAMVLLISWIGFSAHRQNASTESSAVAHSTALERQTTSQTAKRIPAQAMSVIRPITRKRARSRMRRFRTGHDEIEYIGDDVTVRYFKQASVPHRPPNAGGRVTYIGDDVTVRYFQPQPAPPAGR